LTLAIFILSTSVCHAQPWNISTGIQSVDALTNKTVTMTGYSELHLTGRGDPLPGCQIDLNSPDAWLFLENVRPSAVFSTILNRVRVNGAPAVNGVNVRVAEYDMGSVVIPQPADYSPMQVFRKPGLRGKSISLAPYTYYDNTNLGQMNKSVESFTLKRGYMATVAQQPDGGGVSRVYIAQDGDLTVSALPTKLKDSIQFIRVFPWQWIGKKGWCGGDPDLLVDPLWWYNWGNTSTSLPNIEFVPMKWDDKGTNYLNILANHGSTHLLGFNEPNGSDQANMTTDEAIAEWPKMQAAGLRLGSPAPNDGGANWLFDFMDKADTRHDRVDYVAVHFYRCGQSAQQLYEWLKWIHERTGRPIWITEWNNGANWTTCPKPTFEENANVVRSWLDMFERTPWIERYSVYNWVEDCRAMTLNGKLTPAGKVYRDHPSRIGYVQEIPAGAAPDARFAFDGDAADSTGNGNDGMLVGAPAFVSGLSGGHAIRLDGEHNYVQLPAGIGSKSGFSFAAWVNWKGGAAGQPIFSLGDGDARALTLTPSSDDKTLRFAIAAGGNGSEQRLESKPLAPGVWTHIAVTIQDNVGKLYVNGALVSTNANMTIGPAVAKTEYNYLGKSQFPVPMFAGQLQDVLFAGHALTPAEISGLAQAPAIIPTFLTTPQPTAIHGMIGVGTWSTQAEFKDITVTQGDKVLYHSDFSQGLQGWKTIGGKWDVVDGALRQTSGDTNVRALIGDPTWSNYTLTLKARKLGGSEGFLILFGMPDESTKSWLNLGGWGNTKIGLESPELDAPQIPGSIETGRWYDIKVELRGTTVKAYLDGNLVQEAAE
jgi:hypothetical protein